MNCSKLALAIFGLVSTSLLASPDSQAAFRTPGNAPSKWVLTARTILNIPSNAYVTGLGESTPVRLNGVLHPAKREKCGYEGVYRDGITTHSQSICTYVNTAIDLEAGNEPAQTEEAPQPKAQAKAPEVKKTEITSCGDPRSPREKLHEIVEICDYETRFELVNPTSSEARYLAKKVRVCEKFDIGCLGPSLSSPLSTSETLAAQRIVSDAMKESGNVVFMTGDFNAVEPAAKAAK